MASGRILSWAFIVVLVFAALRVYRTWSRLRHIPGPFIASITDLQRAWWAKTGRAELYHQSVHAKYGDVVRIGPRMVSFSDPRVIPIVYPIRPGFPKSDFYATLRPYSPESGAMRVVFNTQDEHLHKTLKSPIAPLFSLSNVIRFEGIVEQVLSCLSEQFDKRFVATGEAADLCEWLQYFAFDVMGSMSFSKTYGFLEHGQDVGGMAEAIFQFFRVAAPMSQITWLDLLFYKNRWVHRFRRTPGMTILGFVREVIHNRIKEADVKNDFGLKPDHDDFLARYLKIHQAHPQLPPWTSTAWTFSNVIAGSDSTGAVMRTVMCQPVIIHLASCPVLFPSPDTRGEFLPFRNFLEFWNMSDCTDHLLANPNTLQSLQEELNGAVLSRPFPKWKEVCDLPYLDACVQEALRIHPPFSLPFERQVPEDGIELLGYHLPGGTLVGGNPYVVNRHRPTFGPDVEQWKPERWLCGDEAHKKSLEQSILTFGAGRRVCLGRHIGILEIKKLVPFLLLTYNIHAIDIEPLKTESGFLFKQRGCFCTMERRE